MIAPLVSSTLSYRPQTAAAPPPQQTAEAAPPKELLDLSSIDCAAEAAQLPLLEPSFQLALTAAIVNTMLGAGSQRQEICVVNKFPGSKLDTLFTLDLSNPKAPLTAQGTFNDIPVKGSVVLGDTAQWTGQLGTNTETIEIGPSLDQGQEAIHLAGTFGTVPADLTFKPLMNGQIFAGVSTTGLLGGYDYLCETRIADSRAVLGGGNTTMVAHGHVGDLEIDKNYTVSVSDGLWTIEGKGVNAGVEQDVFTALSL